MHQASQEMQAEVLRLANANGGLLKPQAVVDAAEPEDSPIHGWFTWDDSEAARAWRVEQARQLIQVTVTILDRPKGEPVTVRALVSLPSDRKDEGGYRLTAAVVSDADMRAEMLTDALGELERIKHKYATLKELVPIFEALDRVKTRAEKRARVA